MYWGNKNQIRHHLPVLMQQYAYLENPGEVCPYPPLTLDVELSNRCNLRCISCFHTHEGFPNLPAMTRETYTAVLDQAAGNCERLTFGNHGENMLHREFATFVEMAKERGFFVNLITNATLLDEAMTERIIAAKMDRIVFSLDSMHPATYEEIRVGASYPQVMRNVLHFLRRNVEAGMPVYVNISTVNTQRALQHRPTVFEYFAELPVHVVFTSDLLNFHYAAEQITAETYFERTYKHIPQSEWPPCVNGWDRLLIRANGDAALCPIDWNMVYSLGNVRDAHFMELWNNQKARTYRRGHLNRDYTEIERNGKLCSVCDAKFANSVSRRRQLLFDGLTTALSAESTQAHGIADLDRRNARLTEELARFE